ncbi:dynein intermediate chain [Novymonas esmeraldas]|uniref:Dynein axonemal intermediate chain 4 n=1 Tax=Novymonas esmeraldas TaxID=1808958 RepID=A0AAW0EQH7_9TRYP
MRSSAASPGAANGGGSSAGGSISPSSRHKQQPQAHGSVAAGSAVAAGGGGAAAAAAAAAAATSGNVGGGGSVVSVAHGASFSSRASLQHRKGHKSTSRLSNATAAAREDARRRMHDMRAELEGVIHVLDGGINRTPLPLQPRHSLVGGVPHELQVLSGGGSRVEHTQDLGGTTNMMNGELGNSFMQSSFMNISSRGSTTRTSVAASSHSHHKVNAGEVGDPSRSLESSLQSLSFAGGGDRRQSDRSSSTHESSSSRKRNAGAGGDGARPLPRLVQQNTLLAEATYTRPAPLTAAEKVVWRRATTTIALTETPTVFLYHHHDEAVSNECAEEVAAVVARNRDSAAVEEAYRTDEGTQFHSTGAITMRAPVKSVQTEVHPPAKRDSGALQVTPWMLKDAYAATLEAAEDAEEDAQEDRQQQEAGGGGGAGGEDGGGGGGGAGDGADVEEALQDGEEMDGTGSVDDDAQSSDNGQSTLLSSDLATRTVGSDGGGATANAAAAATAGVEASRQWMLAETLLSTLRIMERAVVQNNMEVAQLAYRGITVEPPRPTTAAKAAAKPASAAATPGLLSPLPPHGPPADGAAAPASTGGDGATTAAVASHGKPVLSGGGSAVDAPLDGTGVTPASPHTAALAASPTAAAPPVRLSEGVRLLWRFGSAQLTRDRGVACMVWNRRESDMLAVGYTACRPSSLQGDAGDRADDGTPAVVCRRAQGQEPHGMVCCWSLKNPLAPELILYLRGDADVTALAFSVEHPSLLAVGSSTGEIVVYDIQHDVVLPSIAPALVGASGGQHTGAIWELQWVPKGKEQGEFLTSISADGRVVQWAVGKSIERVPPDLMHLQRQPGTQVERAFVAGVAEAEAAAASTDATTGGGKAGGTRGAAASRPTAPKRATSSAGSGGNSGSGGGGAEEAILSRQCGGMCFDICPSDTAVYIVGTEDGSVLQCSKSQTENCDFEYESHTELVYRVRWSPYSAAYFLTCSADWTSRLYKVGTAKAQLRFHSVRQDAVQDVAWSHTNALVFATATAQGNAEVWTVTDAMYPRATVEYSDHRRLSAVLFAEQETPVLVVGDEEGDVTVFSLHGTSYIRHEQTDDEQEAWLAESVRKQLA